MPPRQRCPLAYYSYMHVVIALLVKYLLTLFVRLHRCVCPGAAHRLGSTGARGRGTQETFATVRFRVALRRLSVQRQTANRHDQEATQSHQATARVAPAAFPGDNHISFSFPFPFPLLCSPLIHLPHPLLQCKAPSPPSSFTVAIIFLCNSRGFLLLRGSLKSKGPT